MILSAFSIQQYSTVKELNNHVIAYVDFSLSLQSKYCSQQTRKEWVTAEETKAYGMYIFNYTGTDYVGKHKMLAWRKKTVMPLTAVNDGIYFI